MDRKNANFLAATAFVIVAIQARVLAALGQPFICACGHIKLWEGDLASPELSQHLTDWYSFTHILHGVMFYFLLWLAAPRAPAPTRLLMALAMEACWEIAENTPYIIHLYRQQALAQGYSGDSIVNSLSDTLMMALGFLAAWRLPTRAAIALFVTMEIALAFAIRDNLTLNMLNLLHRFEAVDRWQRGG